jgi:plastocyanin
VAAAVAAPAASARTAQVTIDKLAFGTIPATLRVGDVVVWVNRDLFRHSATAPGHFDIDLPAGGRRRMLLTRSGAFAFNCRYHPGMKGVLRVAK